MYWIKRFAETTLTKILLQKYYQFQLDLLLLLKLRVRHFEKITRLN